MVLVNAEDRFLLVANIRFSDFTALSLEFLEWIIDIPSLLIHVLEHHSIITLLAVDILPIDCSKVS